MAFIACSPLVLSHIVSFAFKLHLKLPSTVRIASGERCGCADAVASSSLGTQLGGSVENLNAAAEGGRKDKIGK